MAVGEGAGPARHRVVVHVVQLAVVVAARRRAQVQVGAAQELGLDLAGPAARLLAVRLKRDHDRKTLIRPHELGSSSNLKEELRPKARLRLRCWFAVRNDRRQRL